MSRGTWVYRSGRLVEKGGPLDVLRTVARSDMPCPMLISDYMPECEHVDGKFYSSKSAYRRVTRQHGLIEVGNEKLRPRPKMSRAERDKGIDQAIDMAIARAG